MQCPRCKSDNCIKNGTFRNKQRFLCNFCKRQFTITKFDVTEAKNIQKRHAVELYLEGKSYRNIATILSMNYKTVYNWLQQFREQLKELRNVNEAEEKSVKELIQLIEIKAHISSNYGLLLIDTETGLSYITQQANHHKLHKMSRKHVRKS